MNRERQEMRICVDGYTRVCLTAIAVLLTVLVLGFWAEGLPSLDEARGAEKFLDTAGQRQATIELQKQTNEKLDQLISLLKSGEVKVQIAQEKGAKVEGGGGAPRKAQ